MTTSVARPIILAALAGGIASLATPASAQDVRRSGNGGWEVHFPGPCTVYYDGGGNRSFSTPACNGTQRRIADDAVRSRLGYGYGNPGYGLPGYGNNGLGWGGQPSVNINAGGWGTVNLRNGCVVTFDSQGNRINDTRPCNSQMRSYAKQLFLNRLYGGNYNQGWPGYGNAGYARPDLSVIGDRITVRMTGTNCTYIYTTGGNHLQSIGSQCSSRLRDIANDAVRNWRGRYR